MRQRVSLTQLLKQFTEDVSCKHCNGFGALSSRDTTIGFQGSVICIPCEGSGVDHDIQKGGRYDF